ncbi:hypothetical protein [Saccharothrix xinjiangensis]|uniref:LysE family translocator n=1 Tax=Saccharothrix xinjiangensis TaxID=204798 RepID=A0ABV9YEX8_9PSEU
MSGRRAFLTGLTTNLVNPKMVTFAIAFLPRFVDPGLGRVWLRFVVLGAVPVVLEIVVDGTVELPAGRIDTATGGVFLGLGVRSALDR